jgi:hypothetical protein
LKELHYENHDWLREFNDTISNTWLMDNNIILKTIFNARDMRRDSELSISISEERKDDYAMRPLYVDLER